MRGRLLLGFSIILILTILIVLSYKKYGVNPHASYQISSMEGIHLAHRDHNKIKWELTAERATFPQGDKEILLDNLTMKIHHNPNIIVKGGRGNYNIEEGSLIVSNPVETTIKNSRLTTDSLAWYGKEEIIATSDSVRFTGKKFLIEGKGLTVTVRDQQVRILSDVSSIFYR